MDNDILELFSKRHSFYDIESKCPLSQDEVTLVIKEALSLYPSPFNSQSSRVLALYGEQNCKFWLLVKQILLNAAPADKAEAIEQRISSFAKGFGTVLYFVDTDIVKNQEKQMPLYATNFGNWAAQSSAMLQFMIWTAFANKGIGASLQHYNPLIDDEIKKTFDIPSSWNLLAQMPFGGIVKTPMSHPVQDIEQKFFVLS